MKTSAHNAIANVQPTDRADGGGTDTDVGAVGATCGAGTALDAGTGAASDAADAALSRWRTCCSCAAHSGTLGATDTAVD